MSGHSRPIPSYFLGFLLTALVPGCGIGGSLTAKGEALAPRYFEPEIAPPTTTTAAKAVPGAPAPEVRLGRISAASHLRDRRVVKRDAELVFEDEKRWTERPDAYVRRALAHALYEEQGVRQAVSGSAPVIDCELTHFEEIEQDGKSKKVRIGLVYAFHDERTVLAGETFTVEVPIEGEGDSNVVHAYEKALRQVVERVVAKVTALPQKTAP